MQLRFSPTSPYVRKVNAAAREMGLAERIELVPANPWNPADDLPSQNPLGKVPALITDDGRVLCDSPLICEYLDSLHDGPRLLPASVPERWRVRALEALADGVLDAAVARITELRVRPEAYRWNGWIERQQGKIARTLDALEAEAAAGAFDGAVTIAAVTLGCALGYLDFRFPADAWRDGRPALTRWYEAFSRRPSMVATVPKDPA
jgi:glutathione S-transferase